jgi:predicted RNA-binding protein YlqC (UPF0109 family)
MNQNKNLRSWDFFISHASEDKEEAARPIANALMESGFEVWFDEVSLTLGDSLSRSIDQGISKSRYGIVILSPSFFAKQWPRRELDSLASLEMSGEEKKILPIWHKIDQKGISEFSPALADKLGISTTKGLGTVIKEIKRSFSQGFDSDTNKDKVSPPDFRGSEERRIIEKVLKPIIEELVLDPSTFSISFIEGSKTSVIELWVRDERELGRVIGKQGRIAIALRTILSAIAAKLRKRLILEIIEP